MSSLVLEGPRLSEQGWLISKREDLTWFIGSSVIGYLAFVGLVCGLPLLPVLIAWSLLIDGPTYLLLRAEPILIGRQGRNLVGDCG